MIKTKTVAFSSRGQLYTATSNDIFMDNGAIIVFIKDGRAAKVDAHRPPLSQKEWERILPFLQKVEYEEYYNRKPLLSGVSIYRLK